MQLKSQACKSTRAIGQRLIGTWSVALLCGSVIAACSGTIDTPSNEYPARQADDSAAAGGTGSSTPSSSNATASAGTSSTPARPPAAAADDEADPPAAADDDPPAAADEDPPAASTTELSFETDVWPIFQSDCGPCHVSLNLGNQNIGADDIEAALSDAKRTEDAVIARIESGNMPQGCGKPPGGGGNCVTEDDFQAIQDWYAAGAPE